MSTKKTGVVHTITAEQKEKMDKQADIQSRMEAGKVEIMKVVEGVQGAEKLAELIERGKKKGNLSSSELLDVLEDMNLDAEQMDKIYDTLENLGIDTVGEDYIHPPGGHGGDPRRGAGGPQLHGGLLRHG